MNRERSRAQFERARRSIPGGVNSPARAFGAVGGEPPFIERGEGPYLYDVDGNRYLDYVGSWGPLILGHAHPEVVAAVEEALRKGTSFGAPTEAESELAEMVIEAVPSVERIRMVSSGTEATMSAIRLARGFTKRDKIIKFAGCYHGHVDSLLVKAGSGAMTHGNPSSPGVPVGSTNDTIVVEYNDVPALEAAFAASRGQIACVILEPVVGNMGVVLAEIEFLEAIGELCRTDGALVIFDEVMTGFRIQYGGVQARYADVVKPDLTTFGKIVGGGMPVGAYGGRADVMDCVSPVGPVYQAGTLSGNPLAMACGIATLKILKRDMPYGRIGEQTWRLRRELESAASAAGVPNTVVSVGSMFTLFFNPEKVINQTVAARCDTKQFARYFWGMLERGIYLPCSQFEANFVSVAHTPEHIDQTIAAAREVLAECQR
ncbi:MAG TPA: glutamate-1-semialdehyde 2,1-aminomutase [Planctomycetaceae bacterium]|jgi:glutamate-1-semialdehyde 2,1-aminomutase|nr:glutamate-1-semialdehyde 2,1-aminomutase [Planctomycetaceae bacterium]